MKKAEIAQKAEYIVFLSTSRRGVGDKSMSCKPGVAGSILGFSQSVGWDFKPWPRLLSRFKIRTTANWAFGCSWT